MKRVGPALCLLVGGCPTPAAPTTNPTSPSPTQPPTQLVQPESCESTADEIGDLGFLPGDAAVVALIDAEDENVGDAVGTLSAFARGRDNGLPINVAFSLAQWSWEIPVTLQTLRRGGLAPRDLVFVLTADGTPAWVVGHHCDTEVLARGLTQEFGLSFRDSTDAKIGTTPGDEFPFDMVLLPGERVAYCPGRTGTKILRAMTQPRIVDPGAPPSAVKTLQAMESSVVRVALAGPGLAGRDSGGGGHRQISVSDDGIEIDGALRR